VYLPAIVIADQLSAKWFGRVTVIDEIRLYSFRDCRVRTQCYLVKTNFMIIVIPANAGIQKNCRYQVFWIPANGELISAFGSAFTLPSDPEV